MPWQVIGMNLAALGTAVSFAKFIHLPHRKKEHFGVSAKEIASGFWPAIFLLLGGLFAANVVYYEAYAFSNIIKPLVTIGLGWLLYYFIFKRQLFKPSRSLEQLEHLIGMMSLILVALFWMALA